MAVHPEEALFVEAGAAALDSVEAEFGDKLVLGKYFLLGAVVPAHGGDEAEHGFGEVAVTDVVEDVFGAVAFAELLVSLLIHDVGHVGEDWQLASGGVPNVRGIVFLQRPLYG